MDPITIGLGLASALPGLVRWITGSDKAAEVASTVVGMAQRVAGKSDPQEAVSAVLADPEMTRQIAADWMVYQVGLYESETKRMGQVNETIRAEIASGDPFVRRARSAFLWAMAGTWTMQSIAIAGAVLWCTFSKPEYAKEVLEGVTGMIEALGTHWLYALTVTGVAVWARTADKQTAAQSPGIIGSIASMIGGRR